MKKNNIFFIPLVSLLAVLTISGSASTGMTSHRENNNKIKHYDGQIKDVYYGQSPYEMNTDSLNNPDASSVTTSNYGRTAVVTTDEDGYDQLYMWGDNSYGQLGNDATTYTELESSTTPQDGNYVTFRDADGKVIKDYTISKVAMSTTSTAAIVNYDSQDYLYMWGDTTNGQLGLGDNPNDYYNLQIPSNVGASNPNTKLLTTPTIVDIRPEGNIRDVELSNSSDGSENFALEYLSLNVGTAFEYEALYSWGANSYGQLGTKDQGSYRGTPKMIDDYGDNNSQEIVFKDFDLGSESAGVILDGDSTVSGEDELYFWGGNSYGEFGNGTTENSNIPQEVKISSNPDINGYENIALTNVSSAVLITDNKSNDLIYSAGLNAYGQLGIDDPSEDIYNTYTKVVLDNKNDSIVDLQAGANSYGITTTNNADEQGNINNYNFYAWGDNTYGQLGIDSSKNPIAITPAKINLSYYDQSAEYFTSFKMEANNSFVITNDINIGYYMWYGWGDNHYKQANPLNELDTIDTAELGFDFGLTRIIVSDSKITNITSTTVDISLTINDPENKFNPSDIKFYSNGNELSYVYMQNDNKVGKNVYEYRLIDLDPGKTYSNISVLLASGYDIVPLNLSFTTLSYDMMEINYVNLENAGLNEATFNMSIKWNKSAEEDLIALRYTLEDITEGTQTDGTIDASELVYNPETSEYNFTIDNLASGHYYSLSYVYLELKDPGHYITLNSPMSLIGSDTLYFMTADEQSVINSVVFDQNSADVNSVNFTVKFSTLGGFSARNLKLSFYERTVDNSTFREEVTPILLTPNSSDGLTFTYRLVFLDSTATYSDFSFYMPTTRDQDSGDLIYDYENPNYQSEDKFATNAKASQIDEEYGMVIEDVNAKKVTFSIKFIEMNTRPELLEIAFYDNENGLQTPDDNELVFLGYQEETDTYLYQVTNLQPHNNYSQARIYEPYGALYDQKGDDWTLSYNYEDSLYASPLNVFVQTNRFWIWIIMGIIFISLLLSIVIMLIIINFNEYRRSDWELELIGKYEE